MRENYTSGIKRRINSFVKRSLGIIKTRRGNKNRFDVVNKYNEQPHSKGVCSTCLFGDFNGDRFYTGLVKPLVYNASIIDDILPGWCIRVYLSTRIPIKIRNELLDAGCEIYTMKEKPGTFTGTVWRFLVASEAKPFVICDADMRLDEQSFSYVLLAPYVKKWLNTDKTFFQRRSGLINIFIPISAGMWGGKCDKAGKPLIPNIKNLIEKYEHDWFGADESFLKTEIWPKVNQSKYVVYSPLEKVTLVVFTLILLLFVIAIKSALRKINYEAPRYSSAYIKLF